MALCRAHLYSVAASDDVTVETWLSSSSLGSLAGIDGLSQRGADIHRGTRGAYHADRDVGQFFAVARNAESDYARGGITVAVPVMTASPRWLVTTVSSFRRFFSSMRSVTVAVAVTVSPTNTGLTKRSSWPI